MQTILSTRKLRETQADFDILTLGTNKNSTIFTKRLRGDWD